MRRALAAAALLCAAPAMAETRQDEQLWLNVTVQGSLGGNSAYFVEVQPRFGEGVSRLNQRILRGAVGWKVSPDLTLMQGYARLANPVPGGPDAIENRSFQQINWHVGKLFGGDLTSRTRIEQRWRSDGDDMAWRIVETLRLRLPLSDRPRTPALLLRAEGYVALDDADWGVHSGLDQGRGFIGVELPAMGKSTIEIGYLNQTINLSGNRLRMNHVAALSLFIRP